MKEGLTALSVYWLTLHLLELCCFSESLWLKGYLSIINMQSLYTKASDNKAKSLHIPISFLLGCAPGAKKSLAFAKNSWQSWVCGGVCVGGGGWNDTANSATVPKKGQTQHWKSLLLYRLFPVPHNLLGPSRTRWLKFVIYRIYILGFGHNVRNKNNKERDEGERWQSFRQ